MSKVFSLSYTLLLSIFINSFAVAQDSTQVKDHSLKGQYTELIQKSNNYQGYKVINQSRLAEFQKNHMDSLKQAQAQLAEARSQLNAQNKAIKDLKGSLSSKEESLDKSLAEVNEVRLLGIPFSKSVYNLFMWGLVFGLGAGLAFIIFRSSSARKEAIYRTKLFDDLSEEFQAYKIKANEKEKRLARELQTEKNKLEEISSRY